MKKMKERIFVLLMTVALGLLGLSTFAFAEETGKTLTVASSEDAGYTSIQDALDAIAASDDADGWTIVVEAGSYSYFTVDQTISELTIQGQSGAVVDTSSGSIQICGDNITLSGLTFIASNTAWSVPVIKDSSSDAGIIYDSMVTITDCDFIGTNAGCALWITRLNSTVSDCTFSGFSYAIEIINETSTAAKVDTACTTGTITITGNTVTDCDFFIHYGVRSGITLVVTDNIVTGSSDKICVSLFAWEGESITVTGNTFSYAAFGLQNAINGVSTKDFLDTNTFDEHSYVADDYYNYTTKADYSVSYYAKEISGKTPVWSVDTANAGDYANAFSAAIEGKENDNPLTFETVNGVGDGVCMGLAYHAINLDYSEADEKTSYPGLTKTLEDGSESGTAAAGDTIGFELTSTVPESLQEYIEYIAAQPSLTDEDGESTTVSYVLTFHDVMDAELVLNESSFAVTVGGEAIDSSYYSVATSDLEDGCTFEVTIDLLALYTDGIITEEDFGLTSIVVSYSATLSESASAGTYTNKAWVSYPEGESKEDQVEVDTYGITIFKYDQSTAKTDEDGNFTAEGLAGAIFGLYANEDCTDVIATLTSGEDGYVSYEGLDAGTYYLKEIEAPDGYVMSETALTISIPGNADAETNLVTANFANYPIPHTGGTGTTRNMIGGALIIVLAGVIFAISRRRKPNA